MPAPHEQDDDEDREEALIGVVLGDRYRVDARIGSGGMGIVYKATHLLIGREQAIKVLRQRHAEHEDVAQRFAQEARIASSVKHANIVDLIDFGTTPGGSPYCVMEYLDGVSLAHELADRGPLDPARALEVAVNVARGLAVAHQAGIIHRDLKPDNVFLVTGDDGDEQVKILDFGIARVAGRKTRLTAAGAVVGTPEYMSPEQARGDELDPRSDLYALGVVLFEALTGVVPLSAESTVGTLTKQVYELAPRLRDMGPAFADMLSVEAALGRLLAKNRDERPTTALDAVRLIQTAAANDLQGSDDLRGRAALDGWQQPPSPDPDLVRRSTVMIGSGSVTQAHDEDLDGPATGDFAAKRAQSQSAAYDLSKRPSVIIKGGIKRGVRRVPPPKPPPSRLVGVETPTSLSPLSTEAMSKTPTPDSNRPLGKPSRGGVRRRHLPVILIAVGAAIFAALVTIGFMRWLQRRGARTSDATRLKANGAEHRLAARALGSPAQPGWGSSEGSLTKTPLDPPVERPAPVFEPPSHPSATRNERPACRQDPPQISIRRRDVGPLDLCPRSRRGENAVG